MIVIRNQEELKSLKKTLNKKVFNSIELDVKTIVEEYPNRDSVNGPLVIVAYSDEKDDIVRKFPLIEKLETEDEEVISKSENGRWERHLYLVNDSGYAIYFLFGDRMFRKNLYITRGINENLHQKLISRLWLKVQENNYRELDYLQIFELEKTDKDNVLKIKWRQEEPEYEEVFFIENVDCDIEKVWIICTAPGTTEEYSTMLLPEEY